jgi:F-type H+-transporting ATPase subunit delta
MNITHHSPLAIAYAQSLLQLAWDQHIAETIGQELGALKQVLDENPNFRLFLADPAISQAARAKTLDHVFRSQVSPLLYNFLGVMNLKGRLGILPQVIDTYKDLLDKRLGNIEVDVTVAQKLTPDEREIVRDRVSAAIGKNAVIHEYVDDAIIGGMVLRIEDKLIDASVRYQLQAIKQKMLSGRLH